MSAGLYGNMHTSLAKDGYKFVDNEHIGNFASKSLYVVEWETPLGERKICTQEFNSSGVCIICECHPTGSQAHAY